MKEKYEAGQYIVHLRVSYFNDLFDKGGVFVGVFCATQLALCPYFCVF